MSEELKKKLFYTAPHAAQKMTAAEIAAKAKAAIARKK